MKNSKKGFTLIELLVVVLIIGVLAAIALPQYNRAVARSRFNALMPITKAMADANEAYYLEHNSYASNPQDLPVEGKTEYPTGTELEFGENMDYAYVLATNASAKNNYIVYQKHSANYPGEIHCEAEEGNAQAEYICESAGGTQNLGRTITEGYTTYVISGEGAGIPSWMDALLAQRMDCTGAEALGFACTSDAETGVKKICKVMEDYSGGYPYGTSTSHNMCRTKTYNEDGSYTSVTCQANEEGVCRSDWRGTIYDANGNRIGTRLCSRLDENGSCASYTTYTSAGSIYDYTYDANGNMLTQRQCSNQNSSTGKCTAYSNSNAYDYTYDANGNQLARLTCSSVDSSGSCTAYGSAVYYTYDANGNKLTQRQCSSTDSNGTCSTYSGATDYIYDANGNVQTQRRCSGSNIDSSGNCTEYNTILGFTYDANGNMLTLRQCNGVDSNGNCAAYYPNGNVTSNYNYTYDGNGNMLTERQCKSLNSSTGECTSYKGPTYVYTYDDTGTRVAYQTCTESAMDSATGDCLAYNWLWAQGE